MISALYFSPIDCEELHRLVARHHLALHRQVLLRDLGHLLLDRGEVLRREGPLVGEVVVEAVLDHRADGDLRVGEQLLHRLRQQVRGRVAQDVERPRDSSVGDDRDLGVGLDAVAGVDQLAVHLAGERGAREARRRWTAAISATVTGPGNDFDEPSGRRMLGIARECLHTITMNLRALRSRSAPTTTCASLRPQGIDLTLLELPIEEIFFRFTKFREWDVSEMSFGKVISLMARAAARRSSPSRCSCRACSAIRRSTSPIRRSSTPKDLEGKRVGIPEWAQTAGIYVRGLLQHEYGVDLARIDWRQAGVREPGRVEKVAAAACPPGVRIQAMPRAHARRHAGARRARRGDLGARSRAASGCSRITASSKPSTTARPRIFPIMHVIVLRREAYERDRWIAMNLFKAFEEAKQRSLRASRRSALRTCRSPGSPTTRGNGARSPARTSGPTASSRTGRRWKPSCSTASSRASAQRRLQGGRAVRARNARARQDLGFHRPGPRDERNRAVGVARQAIPEPLAQPRSLRLVERHGVRRCGALPAQERLPVVVEAREPASGCRSA